MMARSLAVVAIALTACSSTGDDLFEGLPDAAVATDAAPAVQPTLSSIQEHIFDVRCGCHQTDPPSGNLDLTAGAAGASLIGVTADCDAELTRVVASDPAASLIVLKLSARTEMTFMPGCGDGMPLIGDPLPADELAAVRQWIADGASATE